MPKEMRRCAYLSLIGLVPLSFLGMSLLFLYAHSGGIMLQLGVALALPFHLVAVRGLLDTQGNGYSMWIVVCVLQFVYYFVILCMVRLAYKAASHIYRKREATLLIEMRAIEQRGLVVSPLGQQGTKYLVATPLLGTSDSR